MSTIGIVALSLLAGMFLIVQVAGLVILIYLALALRKTQMQVEKEGAAVYAETRGILAENNAEMKAIIESAKSSFGTIRQEMKAILDAQREQTRTVLEEHRKAMAAGIDKINGEALQGAAARSLQACVRLEKAAGVLQQVFLETEPRITNEYSPEETAPETRPFTGPPTGFSISPAMAMDREADVTSVEPQELSDFLVPAES